jgi:hypothetical protein
MLSIVVFIPYAFWFGLCVLRLCVLRMTYRKDYVTLFYVVILSKHHHHHRSFRGVDTSVVDAVR